MKKLTFQQRALANRKPFSFLDAVFNRIDMSELADTLIVSSYGALVFIVLLIVLLKAVLR
jgi:hypothetical protein